jgi:hypothetical protein
VDRICHVGARSRPLITHRTVHLASDGEEQNRTAQHKQQSPFTDVQTTFTEQQPVQARCLQMSLEAHNILHLRFC